MTSSGHDQTPGGSEDFPGRPGGASVPPPPAWGPPPTPPADQTGSFPAGSFPPAAPGAAPGTRKAGLAALNLADWAVAAGTVLYLVFALIPWFRFDFGFGFSISINGFDFGLITFSFVLLVLAAVWAALPAVTEVAVPFPRALVTAGLAAVAFLCTLIEWLRTFDAGFSLMALLTFLVSAAVLVFALLRLLPDVRGDRAVPGSLANAAQWANRPAPVFGAGASGPVRSGPAHAAPPGQPGSWPPPGGQPPASGQQFPPSDQQPPPFGQHPPATGGTPVDPTTGRPAGEV